MTEGRGIDHVVVCVHDLDAAIARYAALGFTLTPRALHPFGTGNAIVQLQGNFIELLAVVEPEKIVPPPPSGFSFGAYNRDFLDAREGMSMLVFESADAHADQRDFAAAGLDTYPVFDFSRQAKLPDGGTATVAFSLAFVTHAAMPQVAFFTCQQHAPELFWKPDYQRHDNGAVRVEEVVMVAAEPHKWRNLFAGLQAPERVRIEGDDLRVETARGSVAVVTPAGFAARFPGETPPDLASGPVLAAFAITATERAAEIARAGGVPVRALDGGGAFVPADELFGVTLALRPASR